MEGKMNKLLIILGIVIVSILSACSSKEIKADQEVEQVKKSGKLGEAVVAEGIELEVMQNKATSIVKKKKKKILYRFKVSGTNVSQSTKGLGAIDFVLKTKAGKEIKIDDSVEAFGDTINAEKSISGTVYFSVDQNVEISKLVYKPRNKEVVSWKVK